MCKKLNRRAFLKGAGVSTGAALSTFAPFQVKFGVSLLGQNAWAQSLSSISERCCLIVDRNGGFDHNNKILPFAACDTGGNIANQRVSALFPDPASSHNLGNNMIGHTTVLSTREKAEYDLGNWRYLVGAAVDNHSQSHNTAELQVGKALQAGNTAANGYLVSASNYVNQSYTGGNLPSFYGIDLQNGNGDMWAGGSNYVTGANNLQSFGITGLNSTQQERFYSIMSGFISANSEARVAAAGGVAAIEALAQQIATVVTIEPQIPFNNTRMGNAAHTVFQIVKGLPRLVQFINIGLGGFDSHGDQEGRHNTWNDDSDQLALLIQNLRLEPPVNGANGSRADEFCALVTSEFGRTNRSNSNDGTDHARAILIELAGDPVSGGINETPNSAYASSGAMTPQLPIDTIIASVLLWTTEATGIESAIGVTPGGGMALFT